MRFSVRPSAQNALFRHAAAPGRCGATPRQAAGHYGKRLNWANALEQPPASLRGGPQASAWGLTARKGAVWAEGLAESAPRARPGHHQAASCGLRRCRELGLREFVWVAASLPWRMWWVSPPGDAGVYTDRRNWPLGAVLGHSCTRLRCGLGLWVALGSQQCTQMGGSGLSMPFWGICVHCCDSRGSCERPWGLARVYTDRRNWPLGSVLRHLCTLLRRELYDANYVGWYEHLNHHGVPVAPPCWSSLPGREDRLCASGAAVRLASSPRQQPTQIPDGPGSSGLYEGREGRPPREGPVTLDLLTRWPRHPAPIQSGA